jgi:hypothetical protein
MIPVNPIYIISKGRWKSRLTSKALERIGLPYTIVVEASEYDEYRKVIDENKIAILPQKYLDEYETCDEFGTSRVVGPGAARNYCWDDSFSRGYRYHWVMDDNIDDFYRLNRNTRIRVRTGAIFRAAEDFVDRYENVAISGLNYRFLCKQTQDIPPFYLNTRVYSCLFIRNDIPYRWRSRYNDDTDLCLRVLKDGWCTILFNAFLASKTATMKLKGGNTESLYTVEDGRLKMAEVLASLHPDVAKVSWKFGRWQHHVDYRPFESNKLVRKAGISIPETVNNYGMVLSKES